jgi:hypothetical protein
VAEGAGACHRSAAPAGDSARICSTRFIEAIGARCI